MEYTCAVKNQVQQVFLVHGEEKSAETLQELLRGSGFEKTYLPYAHQMMEI